MFNVLPVRFESRTVSRSSDILGDHCIGALTVDFVPTHLEQVQIRTHEEFERLFQAFAKEQILRQVFNYVQNHM